MEEQRKGKGNRSNRADPITDEEVEILWSTVLVNRKVLQVSTTPSFSFLANTGTCGREQGRDLATGTLVHIK